MTEAEFDGQFARLRAHFASPDDPETVAADWFAAVKHYHVDALERGVSALIATSTERYWPALGKLLEQIKAKMAGMERTKGSCGTCHGATWVEAWPWWAFGRVYSGFQRCPDCGVPAPPYAAPTGRQRLTAAEYQAWRDGSLEQASALVTPARGARSTAGHGMTRFTAEKP